MIIKNLAFEGGGIKGISYIGVLEYLYKQNHLNDLQCIAGSSMGSIFSLFVVLKLTTNQIRTIFEKPSFLKIFNTPSYFEILLHSISFKQKYGLRNGSIIIIEIGKILLEYTGNENITMKELYTRTNIKLVITGSNISKMKTEYFSHETQPDMMVKKAIHISCSYPFLYQPVQFDDCLFVDGGLYCNLPLNYFDNETTKNPSTLGILITNLKEERVLSTPINNLYEFSFNVFDSLVYQASSEKYLYYDIVQEQRIMDKRVIELVLDSSINIISTINKETKENLIQEGYKCTEHFFKK